MDVLIKNKWDENKTGWQRRMALEGSTSHFDKKNTVDHPPHYNNGEIECIDAIEAMLTPEEFIGYLRGNSLKYRWRFRYKKQPVEDMMKAKWYEEKLLSFFKKTNLSVEKRDEHGQKSGANC